MIAGPATRAPRFDDIGSMIYLDHNATTPVLPQVVDAMLPYLREEFGNASSAHQLGSRARCAVEEAREQVAAVVGAAAPEVVFTSGGTESNNLAIQGIAARARGHIVTTAVEHASVLATCAMLEKAGWSVTRVGVDAEGRVDPESIAAALTPATALVSVGWANNEIGTIQPIERIGEICRERGVPLHVDAVQAVGKVAVRCDAVDLLSISAHKIGGPKGAGALFVRRGVGLRPVLWGGPHERQRRAGTENVAGIVGCGVACAMSPEAVARGDVVRGLRERLWGALADIPGTRRNSPTAGCLPNTLNLSVGSLSADALIAGLDLRGIAVASGSACAAGASEPSHVLRAIGLGEREARNAMRFSLGPRTPAGDVDAAARAVRELHAARAGGEPAAHG